MIGRVPWRSHRFQSPSLALHRLPLRKNCIGRVIAVKRGVGARTVIIKDKRSAAQYGSAGRLLQWTTCRTVIAMRVSTDDSLQRSEEHTSELQSLMRISYAVFCLKKKKN